MSDLLKAHALANIWCEPSQDRQYTIRPARLTPRGGAFKRVQVIWDSIPLPDSDVPSSRGLYHVYQLGQIDPGLLNINQLDVDWVPMTSVMLNNNMYVLVYLDNGARVPLSLCWLRLNHDRNLILAVRLMPTLDLGSEPYIIPNTSILTTRGVTLDNHPINIRFYSNARMDSESWQASVESNVGIRVVETLITSQNDYSLWLSQTAAMGVGYGTCWLDGWVIANPTVWDTGYIGRVLSWVWDATVNAVETYPLADMPVFLSQLDVGRQKYLVVRDARPNMIDYYDDIEFYVVDTTGRGVVLPQLIANTVRMVTHNTYAIRQDLVTSLLANHPQLTVANASIKLVVRTGGGVRGLVHQHSRIDELYLLNRSDILTAMSAANTTVPEWHAATLEASAYVTIMRSEAVNINAAMLEDAYGYNAASLAMANPSLSTVNVGGIVTVGVPVVATVPDVTTSAGRRTVYGYDVNGKLIGWVNDLGGYRDILLYPPLAATARAEVFNYITSTTVDGVYYDVDVTSHDLKQYGFRCYACPIVGGVPSEDWTDITDTPYYTYDPVGNVGNGWTPSVQWSTYLTDYANLYTCLRIEHTMHFYTAPAATLPYRGFIQFEVLTEAAWLGGTVVRPQSLPPGTVDVFMDGRSLIEGIDYYLHWPTVTVVRRPTTAPDLTVIEVRSYGSCNPTTMQHHGARERGFVQGGILSVDGRYDIRNDRPTRIVVAGGLVNRSMVRLAEDQAGVYSIDGRPYALTDYVTSVAQYVNQHTVEYYLASVDMDRRVSDYLTPRLATETVRYPFVQIDRWSVVSPFCSAVLHALNQGYLNAGELDVPYTDAEIHTWMQPWLHLLTVDPAAIEFDVPGDCVTQSYHNYVIIYPHPYLDAMTLTQPQYSLVERLITIYLNQKTDLTPSVIIGV